jgi:hypothetical protein
VVLKFLSASTEITAKQCSIFNGQIIATQSHSIFAGHPKPPKVTFIFGELFSAAK